MLSRLASEFAAEIANHDWSDAPWRLDRAGHRREHDTNRGLDVLSVEEANKIRTNVMWVTAQVLMHADSNLNLREFADACGVRGLSDGTIKAGMRLNHETGKALRPGPWVEDE